MLTSPNNATWSNNYGLILQQHYSVSYPLDCEDFTTYRAILKGTLETHVFFSCVTKQDHLRLWKKLSINWFNKKEIAKTTNIRLLLNFAGGSDEHTSFQYIYVGICIRLFDRNTTSITLLLFTNQLCILLDSAFVSKWFYTIKLTSKTSESVW